MLNNSLPIKLIVRDTSSVESATRLYSIIADYNWCEVILCSEMYHKYANDIAKIIGNNLNIPVESYDT